MPINVSSWDSLLAAAREKTPARRVRRPQGAPSTAPIPRSLATLAPGERPPVLLYRDSNSWCPFCERVWFALEEKGIPFETEFIDLSNKPQWYLELVPTALVPAAKIDGELVYESKYILLALEARFPSPSLLPEDPDEKAIAYQLIEAAETNGFRDIAYQFLRDAPEDPEALALLQQALEVKLDELEQAISNSPGPYFLSTFSLVDILYSPHLDRLAANLPVYRGYHLKGNPRYPKLTAWFEALKQRPAYHLVNSDPITNNLLLRRRFGVQPLADLPPLDSELSQDREFRAEAAERLSDNRDVAIADILKNSGVQALASEGREEDVRLAIDTHLRLLAQSLLQQTVPLLWGRIGGKEWVDPHAAAVGAIALAYVRNRICAPRDMSAGAATAFRAAADRLLSALY